MNRRAIRLCNLRGLRSKPGRTALTMAAVGAGVALVVGVVIANHSLDRSLTSFATAIGGDAALRVEGTVDHGGLDASNLPKVAAVDGVRAAVPMILAITEVADSTGHMSYVPVLGVDCSVQAITGSFGCTPDLLARLDGRPALGPALAARLGRRGELRTDVRAIPIVDAPVVPQLADVNGGLVAMFDLETAQRELVRPDGLDVILVMAEPGVDPDRLQTELQRAVGAHNVVSTQTGSPLGTSLVASLILPFLLLISLVGLLIGAQLVRNTVELSLEERRRELATAAALGASPRDLVIGVLVEATMIGLAGGLIGLALGMGVATAFVDSLSDQLARATGLRIDVALTPIALVVGVVVGVLVCLASAIGPARRASRRELAAELSERGRFELPPSRSSRRLVVAAVGIGGSVVCSWIAHRGGSLERWQPTVLIAGMMVSTLLTFQVPGLLVVPVLTAVRGRRWFATGAARVALDNLLSLPKRTAAVASAVAAPALMAVVLSSVVPGIGSGASRLAEQGSVGRVYASTVPSNNGSDIDAKATPDMQAQIAAHPHVARIDEWQFAEVEDPVIGRFEVDGVEGQVPDYDVYLGDRGPRALAAGRAMVGPRLARDLGLRPGDELEFAGRYGPVSLIVGGVWASPAGIGRGVTVTSEVLRSFTGPRPPDRLQIVPTPGVTPIQLAAELRAADIDPRLTILDPKELAVDYRDEFTSIASPFWAMQRAILLVALVATASTLLLSGIQRRRETALLAALGMAPRSLARTTLIETLLLGVTATTIAAASAQVQLLSFTWASEVTTGLVIPYRPQLGGFAVAAATATAVALLGAALPAWRTTRIDPATALREA